MNTRKAMSEAIAVLDAPGSQGVGRTMYLKTRWTKVEASRSGRLLSRAGGQDTRVVGHTPDKIHNVSPKHTALAPCDGGARRQHLVGPS